MQIYLMRHGTAQTPFSGGEQKLTAAGKVGVQQTADYIKNENITFDIIVSSPKLRARQTAGIVADTIDYPKADIVLDESLTPNAATSDTMRFLSRFKDKRSILAVGHLPSMPRLAAAMISVSFTHPFPNANLYRIDADTIPPSQAEFMLLFSPDS
ncbi:phosphohistidine phosphatase SixA [bacterium E08(2017)]|nr:phosphohistidine phosphatase SixA [bacterium E08(2017)]